MGCRRKTKTERELVADINKTFSKFCNKNQCGTCRFRNDDDCKLEYIKELLALFDKDEDEE